MREVLHQYLRDRRPKHPSAPRSDFDQNHVCESYYSPFLPIPREH
jgi:hypothetical protein